MALHVSVPFPGATNDQSICKYNPFLRALNLETRYRDFQFNLYTGTGTETVLTQGAYVISDGGYTNERIFQPPQTCSVGHAVAYSKRLESVRKDVEDFFGIMKKRWFILKHPLRVQHNKIDAIVKTAVVLHNMLLKERGGDRYESLPPSLGALDIDEEDESVGPAVTGDDQTQQELQRMLIRSQRAQLNNGNLFWVRSATDPTAHLERRAGLVHDFS
jgi:hypothetical protein